MHKAYNSYPRTIASAGNTSFRTYGSGILTVPANTIISSVQAFARIATGGSASGKYISIFVPGFVNSARVPISESYYNVPSNYFIGIPAYGSQRQYEVQFYAPDSITNYGIALFFN